MSRNIALQYGDVATHKRRARRDRLKAAMAADNFRHVILKSMT
jgi:hypothetical protein